MKSSRSLSLIVAALGMVAHSHVNAATAIVSFGGGAGFGAFSTDETIGWRFTVGGGGVNVASLGWLDTTTGTPLSSPHQVGVWSLSGTLLDSATVQVNSPLTGSFRYVNLAAPLFLAPGDYVIGGRDTGVDGDNYLTNTAGLVTGQDIFFVQAAVSPNGSGFAFPSNFSANTGGRFGPNFTYTSVSAVPEPGAATGAFVAGAGMVGLVFRRRRRVQLS